MSSTFASFFLRIYPSPISLVVWVYGQINGNCLLGGGSNQSKLEHLFLQQASFWRSLLNSFQARSQGFNLQQIAWISWYILRRKHSLYYIMIQPMALLLRLNKDLKTFWCDRPVLFRHNHSLSESWLFWRCMYLRVQKTLFLI